MNRTRSLFVAVAMLAIAVPASAQRFGVQASWADDVDIGIGGRVELDFPDLFTTEGPFSRTYGIGSFDYFFWDCGGPDSIDCTYWELNAGLAIPLVASGVDPYVGAGLNLARVSVDANANIPGFDDTVSDTEVGLNLLGGLRFPLGSLSAYGEGRLELGGGEQFVLTFGILVGGGGN